MNKRGFFTIILVLSLFWQVPAFARELTVAAAANVQYTLEELKTEFEKTRDIKLKTIIGSSGKLTAQIENGAPFDIFMSADMDYPQTIYKEGLASSEPKIYSYGTLVIWTMKNLDLSQGMNVLSDKNVRKIAVANPKTAPYGRQAINAIKYYNLYPSIENKLVYGESIAQTNQFIMSQAADVGLTAKSVVLASVTEGKGKWVEVDPKVYEPIAQGVVILKHSEQGNVQAAQEFYNFLFSNEAREIFKKYGYVVP